MLSAVPFLSLLIGSGWTTAYTTVAALGVLSLALTAALVRDTPPGTVAHDPVVGLRETLGSVKTVWLRPGTRLGFFTHMGTQFSVTVFALMWGVPYLTAAQNIPRSAAGTADHLGGRGHRLRGAHRHHHRPPPAPAVVAGAGHHRQQRGDVDGGAGAAAPGAALGAGAAHRGDLGRRPGLDGGLRLRPHLQPAGHPGHRTGRGQHGRILASLLVMQAMGLIIGAAGGYSFSSFRLAWCVQYVVWAVAVVGILITRRKARRTIGDIEESRYLLEFFTDAELQSADPRPGR